MRVTNGRGRPGGAASRWPLLDSVLGQLEVPVRAAGGIGDGRASAARISAVEPAGQKFRTTRRKGYDQQTVDEALDSYANQLDSAAAW